MTDTGESRSVCDADSTAHFDFLGAVVTVLADASDTGGALAVLEIDAPVGYRNNLHAHPPRECFYVLSGELTLYVNDQRDVLTSGMMGIVPSNAPHGYRVTGADPVRMLSLFTPAGIEEFFREAGTPVETRTLPEYHGPSEKDIERMAALSPEYAIRRIGPLPDQSDGVP